MQRPRRVEASERDVIEIPPGDSWENLRQRFLTRKDRARRNGSWFIDDRVAINILASNVCDYCAVQTRVDFCLADAERGFIYGNVFAACKFCAKTRLKHSHAVVVALNKELAEYNTAAYRKIAQQQAEINELLKRA